jgi:hypothetical protein
MCKTSKVAGGSQLILGKIQSIKSSVLPSAVASLRAHALIDWLLTMSGDTPRHHDGTALARNNTLRLGGEQTFAHELVSGLCTQKIRCDWESVQYTAHRTLDEMWTLTTHTPQDGSVAPWGTRLSDFLSNAQNGWEKHKLLATFMLTSGMMSTPSGFFNRVTKVPLNAHSAPFETFYLDNLLLVPSVDMSSSGDSKFDDIPGVQVGDRVWGDHEATFGSLPDFLAAAIQLRGPHILSQRDGLTFTTTLWSGVLFALIATGTATTSLQTKLVTNGWALRVGMATLAVPSLQHSKNMNIVALTVAKDGVVKLPAVESDCEVAFMWKPETDLGGGYSTVTENAKSKNHFLRIRGLCALDESQMQVNDADRKLFIEQSFQYHRASAPMNLVLDEFSEGSSAAIVSGHSGDAVQQQMTAQYLNRKLSDLTYLKNEFEGKQNSGTRRDPKAMQCYASSIIELSHSCIACVMRRAKDTDVSMSSGTDAVLLLTLWRDIFNQCMNLLDFEEAYVSLLAMRKYSDEAGADGASEFHRCMTRYIKVACDKSRADILCNATFLESFKTIVVDTLSALAADSTVSETDEQENAYDCWFAFHLSNGEYAKAAQVMYDLHIRLEAASKSSGAASTLPRLTKHVNVLVSVVTCLQLVDDGNSWVVDRTKESVAGTQGFGNTNPNPWGQSASNQGAAAGVPKLVTCEAMEEKLAKYIAFLEYVETKAMERNAGVEPDSTFGVNSTFDDKTEDVNSLVVLLAEAGLNTRSLSLAVQCHGDAALAIRHLAQACVTGWKHTSGGRMCLEDVQAISGRCQASACELWSPATHGRPLDSLQVMYSVKP